VYNNSHHSDGILHAVIPSNEGTFLMFHYCPKKRTESYCDTKTSNEEATCHGMKKGARSFFSEVLSNTQHEAFLATKNCNSSETSVPN
jgi:hypothetical protein